MALRETLNANFKQLQEENKVNNAYLTGQVSTEKKMFEQVKGMKTSTFDRSKFTVVGSPTITDDGIASGVNNSNQLQLNNLNLLGNELVFKGQYIWNGQTISTNNWIFEFKNETNSESFSVYFGTTSNKINTYVIHNTTPLYNFTPQNITANIPVNVVVKITSSSMSVKYVQSDIIIYENTITNNIPNILVDGIKFLTNHQGTPLQGSIDLKQFSITVDGVEVFNGNKTGVDQIKKDDYTKVGSPIITDDGVASDFSASNYFNTIKLKDLKDKSWKICTKVSLNQSSFVPVYDQCPIIAFGGSWLNKGVLALKGSNSNTLNFTAQTVSGTTEGIRISKSFNTKPTDLYVELAFNITNSTYSLHYDIGNGLILAGTWTPTDENNQIYHIDTRPDDFIRIGNSQNSMYFGGSIDLNSFKIYVDGNLVYQPTLRIPYTQSKTGSKIVDSNYRYRVQDMYEQFGQANYYTLGEDNTTLPMGEVYGMIESNKHIHIIKTFEDGTSGYRIWSDGYCEQWGNLIPNNVVSNVESTILLLKKFKDIYYCITTCNAYPGAGGGAVYVNYTGNIRNKTTSSFILGAWCGKDNPASWKASGYLAEGEF